jgi:hypothetical protein
MTSSVFTFIATRTTYATTIPLRTPLNDLTRRVRNTLSATDYPTRVGELRDFPLATAIPGFLLCDGSEIARVSFPELYAYLGDSQGTATSSANFLLPNYVGTKTQAPTAPAQTIVNGTVNTGGTTTTPSNPGQTGGTVGGSPVSGGRPQTLRENEEEV